MEPAHILQALRRQIVLVVILAGVGAASGLGLAATGTPVYASTASALVSTQDENGRQDVSSASTVASVLMPTIIELGTSDPVATDVATATGTDAATARGSVSLSSPTGTLLLEVTAAASTPEGAQKLAQAEVEALRGAVGDLSYSSGGTRSTYQLEEVNAATLPTAPIGPSKSRDALIGLIAGLLLGAVASLLLDLRSTRAGTQTEPGSSTAPSTTNKAQGTSGESDQATADHD